MNYSYILILISCFVFQACTSENNKNDEISSMTNLKRAQNILKKHQYGEIEGMNFELNEENLRRDIPEAEWAKWEKDLAIHVSDYEAFRHYNEELKVFIAEINQHYSKENREVVNQIIRDMAYKAGKNLTDLNNIVQQYPQYFSEEALSSLRNKLQ